MVTEQQTKEENAAAESIASQMILKILGIEEGADRDAAREYAILEATPALATERAMEIAPLMCINKGPGIFGIEMGSLHENRLSANRIEAQETIAILQHGRGGQ